MKRIIAIILCIAMLALSSACDSGDAVTPSADTSSVADASSEAASSIAEETKTPVKILPIGDSMTEGSRHDDCGGYRVPLIKMLEKDNVPYEFVGLYDTASDNTVSGQAMHSGKDGATIFEIEKALPKMINLKPDIILLMVGRQEATDGIHAEKFIEYFDKYIIKKIIKYFPDAVVYVSSIPPVREYAGPKRMDENDIAQKVTNPLMKALIEAKQAEGASIEWVDMSLEATGLTWEDFLTDDNVNPLPSGNEKLAAVWYNAIKEKISEISANINK